VLLTVVAPGFTGNNAVNTGSGRVALVDPDQRERTQADIANYISTHVGKLNNARVLAVQQQTIQVGRSSDCRCSL
jgi:multidrug efflux pump